jgi:N-acetylglucosamine-6-phosphate deacetylase
MFSLKGRIVTLEKIVDGYLVVRDGRIAGIEHHPPGVIHIYDYGAAWIVPGFIDLHTHGIGAYEPLDVDGLIGMAREAVRFGTTALLPTGAAMSVEQYVHMGQSVGPANVALAGMGAKILGVHLEGPFINPASSGAMAQSTRRPISLSEATIYVKQIGAALKLFTCSPELDGGIELIRYLRENGIVPSLGHSIAEGEQIVEFVKAGLAHVVHMFNAFVPSGMKEPGVLKAGLIEHILLNESLTCEFICDMQHVAPEWIKIAARVLGPDRFVAITDSLYGAGLAGGLYQFPNGGKYRTTDGAARLCGGEWDGCLAGSVLTMNNAFGHLIKECELDPVLAAKYTSLNAAKVIGVAADSGCLAVGKKADIAVLNDRYQCMATYIDGALVFQA